MEVTAKKSTFRTVELAYIALGAALISVCAWITVPLTVPFTMQLFAVFFVLTALGGRNGTIAIAVYLLLGAVGCPVFAGFTGGFGALIGMTGGYLIGMLLIGLTRRVRRRSAALLYIRNRWVYRRERTKDVRRRADDLCRAFYTSGHHEACARNRRRQKASQADSVKRYFIQCSFAFPHLSTYNKDGGMGDANCCFGRILRQSGRR